MQPGLMQPIHAATGKTEGDAVNGRIRGPGTTGSRRHFIAKEILLCHVQDTWFCR
jgi:hypothetical protein